MYVWLTGATIAKIWWVILSHQTYNPCNKAYTLHDPRRPCGVWNEHPVGSPANILYRFLTNSNFQVLLRVSERLTCNMTNAEGQQVSHWKEVNNIHIPRRCLQIIYEFNLLHTCANSYISYIWTHLIVVKAGPVIYIQRSTLYVGSCTRAFYIANLSLGLRHWNIWIDQTSIVHYRIRLAFYLQSNKARFQSQLIYPGGPQPVFDLYDGIS